MSTRSANSETVVGSAIGCRDRTALASLMQSKKREDEKKGEGGEAEGAEKPAAPLEEGEVGVRMDGAGQDSGGHQGEGLGDVSAGVDDLGLPGGGGDGEPTCVFGSTVAEELGVLEVLALGPGFGIHDGDEENPGALGGHLAHDVLVVAVEADGGADFPKRGVDGGCGGAADAVGEHVDGVVFDVLAEVAFFTLGEGGVVEVIFVVFCSAENKDFGFVDEELGQGFGLGVGVGIEGNGVFGPDDGIDTSCEGLRHFVVGVEEAFFVLDEGDFDGRL